MLREFRVDNFKSLINVVFQPQDANLLTGRNNSGKTNLCQALRFVSGSSAFELDKVADTVSGMRFGMTSFALDKATSTWRPRRLPVPSSSSRPTPPTSSISSTITSVESSCSIETRGTPRSHGRTPPG